MPISPGSQPATAKLRRIAGGDGRIFDAGNRTLERREPFKGRVRAIAFIVLEVDVLFRHLAGVFILVELPARKLHDFLIEPAGRLACGRTLLALQRVLVLRFARDVVLLRDVVGGVEHRHIDVGRMTQKPLFGVELGVDIVLHHRDRFDAAADDHVGIINDDAL